MTSDTTAAAEVWSVSHLMGERSPARRFYFRAEDEPFVTSGYAETLGMATDLLVERLHERLRANGSGVGLVYDRRTDQIVLVLSHIATKMVEGAEEIVIGAVPLAADRDLEEVMEIVRNDELRSIWRTLSD